MSHQGRSSQKEKSHEAAYETPPLSNGIHRPTHLCHLLTLRSDSACNSPCRLQPLTKSHNLRLFTSLQIINHHIDWNRSIFCGHRIAYLAHRSLAIDKIDNLIGVKRSAILHPNQAVRLAIEQLDLAHPLASQ